MSNQFSTTELIAEFEQDCKAAEVAPTAVLKAAGLHPSVWWRWKSLEVSPTLRSFEAVRVALASLKKSAARRGRAA